MADRGGVENNASPLTGWLKTHLRRREFIKGGATGAAGAAVGFGVGREFEY